jgi:RHS repeat-associated protein
VGPDFRHDFEVTHQSGTTGRAAVWALSNDLDDVKNWDDDDDEAVSVTLVGAASPTLVLTDHESAASDTSTALTTQTTYYCTVERTADTTVECRIYSDLGRTTLVDTLSVSVTSGRVWRYLVACNSYNDNEADAISFDVENLRAGDETIDYYYNTSWQVVEERKNGSSDPLAQYVWDIRYIDAPVLRWRDDNLNGDFLDSNETLYYTQDANFNVTALVNTSGTVLERTMYDPYGKPTFYDANWANPSGASDYANEVLFAGYRYDTETGLYHVRHRTYHPTLGRWMQRDPDGYGDGMGLYEYTTSSPASAVDPLGLRESRCGPGCCPGQDNKANTDKVNNYIRTRFRTASNAGVFLAMNAHGRAGADTNIEMALYSLLKTGTPGLVFGDTLAKCVKICGVCIGTDKIGHMFQQGHMLRAIKQHMMRNEKEEERAEEYAEAFSQWTEGLYKPDSYPEEVGDWLREERLPVGTFHGYEPVSRFRNKYGGRWFVEPKPVFGPEATPTSPRGGYWLERSRADHAANLSGMKMWERLEQNWSAQGIEKFDICDFIGPQHQDIGGPSESPAGERLPGWQP